MVAHNSLLFIHNYLCELVLPYLWKYGHGVCLNFFFFEMQYFAHFFLNQRSRQKLPELEFKFFFTYGFGGEPGSFTLERDLKSPPTNDHCQLWLIRTHNRIRFKLDKSVTLHSENKQISNSCFVRRPTKVNLHFRSYRWGSTLPGLSMLGPQLWWAKKCQRMCLQNHLQTSPQTLKNSYAKFQKHKTTLDFLLN